MEGGRGYASKYRGHMEGGILMAPRLRNRATATIKTKISGTFVEKPQMVKVGGTFQ